MIAHVDCPEALKHLFHLECIEEWSKISTTCPLDRHPFKLITTVSSMDHKPIKSKAVEPRFQDVNTFFDFISHPSIEEVVCQICSSGDNDDVLILCSSCNTSYKCR